MASCLIRERSSTLAKGQEGRRRRRRIAGVTHRGKGIAGEGMRLTRVTCTFQSGLQRVIHSRSFSPPPRQAFHQVRCTPSHRFSSRPPSLFALYLIDNRPPENDTRPAISYFVRREHDRRWIILRLIVSRYFVSWIVELKISLMTDRIYVSIYLDKKIYKMNISNVRILQFVFCQEKL